MPPSLNIIQAELNNPQHGADILAQLDLYARDPMVTGAPLQDDAVQRLLPGLKSHAAVVMLAYEEGQAVGLAICFRGFSTFKGRSLLNVHDFAVHPSARGRGVGQQLLEAVFDMARQLDCCKVTLEVNANNHAARRLYLRCGFDPGEPETTAQSFWSKTL